MLNRPSKNWVAQCASLFPAGFWKVTVVPTGTLMTLGAIAFCAVDSTSPGVDLAAFQVRARVTVLFIAPPGAGVPSTGWRAGGGVGAWACGTVPPSLNAHRKAPRGEL